MGEMACQKLSPRHPQQPLPPLGLPQFPGRIPLRSAPAMITSFSLDPFRDPTMLPHRATSTSLTPILRFLDWTVGESPRPRLSRIQEGVGRICDEMLEDEIESQVDSSPASPGVLINRSMSTF